MSLANYPGLHLLVGLHWLAVVVALIGVILAIIAAFAKLDALRKAASWMIGSGIVIAILTIPAVAASWRVIGAQLFWNGFWDRHPRLEQQRQANQ